MNVTTERCEKRHKNLPGWKGLGVIFGALGVAIAASITIALAANGTASRAVEGHAAQQEFKVSVKESLSIIRADIREVRASTRRIEKNGGG